MKKIHRYIAGLMALLIIIVTTPQNFASAAVSDWQKGISLYPRSNNDFASQTFKDSLAIAASDKANTATFIIPYYQSSHTSSDIQTGWNTPTDASLIAGINYAKSLGMMTALKIHLSPYQGDAWAAYIDPSDRAAWYAAYTNLTNKYADFARINSVNQFVIGNELTSTTDNRIHSDNTSYWNSIIQQVRARYSGSVIYNANWGGCDFCNEKAHIAFWNNLDQISISAYTPLDADRTSSWDNWNRTDVQPLVQQFNKPVLFGEIGYRSVSGARLEPWNYTRDGAVDMQEQVDDYQALFSFWNTQPNMKGINIWNWETYPNAGGANSKEYTIQNKPAEAKVKEWFGGNNPPPPPPPPTGGSIDVWWIANEANVSGLQPLKALLSGRSNNEYEMFWQVDGGTLNPMYNSNVDYPHKETLIDVSGWNWRANNRYVINYVAKRPDGTVISTKSVTINVSH